MPGMHGKHLLFPGSRSFSLLFILAGFMFCGNVGIVFTYTHAHMEYRVVSANMKTSRHSPLYLLRHSVALNLVPTCQLDWLTTKPWKSSCLCLTSLGLQAHSPTLAFYVDAGRLKRGLYIRMLNTVIASAPVFIYYFGLIQLKPWPWIYSYGYGINSSREFSTPEALCYAGLIDYIMSSPK